MSLPVLTAVTGAGWESALVTALERGATGVRVVRRCVDLPDLLAAAASGQARAVILSADLRRLDRDAVARLRAAGVAVVGVVTPGDEASEQRLRRLGVSAVVAADVPARELVDAVTAAVATATDTSRGGDLSRLAVAEPRAALPDLPPVGAEPAAVPAIAGGRLVACWGPTGAPGRTTVAVTLAAELARLPVDTLLADADVYGGVVAQVLGLLDEAPGLAAACRSANAGTLDRTSLARQARGVLPQLRVLTGIARAERWPELSAAALEIVWQVARELAAVTVVDCGFCLEQDEEISFDTAAPRRNGATLTTLVLADVVLAVGAADPVGLQRLIRGLVELREAVPHATVRVVVNGVRDAPVGGDAARQVRAALDRYAGVPDPVLVPYDRAALDTALAQGRTLAEVAPRSAVRRPLRSLAAELAGAAAQRHGRAARPALA